MHGITMILMTSFPLLHIKMNDSRRRGCSQLLEPHWGCLIDKCAVFHGLLCCLLLEGTLYWYYKIRGLFLNAAVLLKFSVRYVQGRNYLFSSWNSKTKAVFTESWLIPKSYWEMQHLKKQAPLPPKKNPVIRLQWNKIHNPCNTTAIINSRFW